MTSRGHGVLENGYALDPSLPTFMQALQGGGWRTGAFGSGRTAPASRPRPARVRLLREDGAYFDEREAALALALSVDGGILLGDLGYRSRGDWLAETSFSGLWDRFIDRTLSRSWQGLRKKDSASAAGSFFRIVIDSCLSIH